MPDLFISKSTKDDALALSLVQKLERNGISCWIANNNLHTKPGENYAGDIVDAIEESRAFLLILSKYSNKSAHCVNEVTTACDKKKKVFVFQIEAVTLDKTLIYYLSQIQWVKDYEVKKTGNFEKVITEIAQCLDTKLCDYTDGFVDIEYQRQSNFSLLAKKTYEKRRSLIMSIYDKGDEEKDFNHVYESIVRLDVVDSEKNYWSSYRFLTIRNEIDSPTSFIVHRESGESKASFKEMKIRARLGGISGEKLKVESLTEIQPNEMQVFRILFPEPLDPGESITIFYRLDWPNEPSAYYMKELSQSISLSRYTKGVERLTFAVFEPYKMLSSILVEIDDMNVTKTSNLKPQMLQINEEELLSPLHDKEYYGIKYTIDAPTSILYQIKYTKEEIADDDDDDDFF